MIHVIINSNKTDKNKKGCFINGRGNKMAGLKNLPIGIENFEDIEESRRDSPCNNRNIIFCICFKDDLCG